MENLSSGVATYVTYCDGIKLKKNQSVHSFGNGIVNKLARYLIRQIMNGFKFSVKSDTWD